MILRNRAFVGALAFVCTLLCAHPSPVRAEDYDAGIEMAPLAAQQGNAGGEAHSFALPTVVPTEFNGDVRDLPRGYGPPAYLHRWNEYEGEPKHPVSANVPVVEHKPIIAAAPMPTPTSFAGIGFSDSVTGGQAGAGWPPDTNGDVGPTVYIQAVNDAYGIYDKATGLQLAAFTENSLWSIAGTGTLCDTKNEGDPVVLHDGLADRWILTNFAFGFKGTKPTKPYYQCFAVSKTSDPVSGGWWFYAVHMDTGLPGEPPAGDLNDYGKFGLWNDGCLYGGFNEFPTTGYDGVAFASFNTVDMYAGAPLTSALGLIPYSGGNPFSMFPANLLGTSAASMPAVGTPEYFVAEEGNTPTVFGWIVRKFTPGPNCGAGGTMSAPITVTQGAYTVNTTTTDFVPQKTTATTNKLDSLEDRIMQKVQYRRIGAAESLWVTHTVGDGSTAPAQPQWAQLDVSAGIVATTPVQEQIYAPDSTLYRWMPSLAVDKQGNMALGYSTSSSTAFPGIAYSGRLVTDPLNQLPQTEVVMQAGSGAQTTYSRWGDYSSMSIDPVDDCTFWYTTEYYATTGTNWQTRIGSFKFPGCTTVVGPATHLAFQQQPTNTTAGSSIAPAVTVRVLDAANNLVTSSSASITIAIGNNAGGSTLSGTLTTSAVNGVATFSNLSLNKIGTGYTLTAASSGLTGATSNAFNITAGAADHLAFAQQPTNTTAGAAITPAVTVQILDASGNLTSSTANVTIAIGTNPSGGTLSGTTTVAAVGGLATFSNLSIDKVGTGYTLSASSGALTGATSSAFNITVGAVAKLAFAQQPTNTTAGAAITPAVTVQILDASGNLTSSTANVTIAIGTNPGGGTLSGTTTVAAVSGVATFSNLSIDKIGAGYTLAGTSAGLTGATSSTFNITAGAADHLAFAQQPTNTTAGAAITPAVTVQILDASGNLTGSAANVTLAIGTNPSGGTLSGTATVAAVGGVATFSNLSINKVGTGYTLAATSGALTGATSTAFNITAGAADHLAFAQQPTNTTAGAAISPAVTVQILDASGNLTSSTANVTIAIGTNPSGGTLSGTATIAAVGGVATFSNLSIDKVGTGYTLAASSGLLTGATSSAFNITVGAAAKLAFVQQPTNTTAGAKIAPPVTVQILDASGNLTSSTANVTIAIGTNPSGGTLSGTTTVAAVGGVATFTDLSIDKIGTGYTLVASSTGLTGATSSAFNITAGTADHLAFAQQPTNTAAGAAITPAVTVQILDASGNLTSSTANVTIAIGTNPSGGTLSGTATVAAVGGVATFSNLSINKVGTGYTLAATSGALTGATSTAFNITAGAADHLAFAQQPTNTAAGAKIAPPVTVQILDASGNVTGSTANVTIAIGTNPSGGTLSGTTTVAAVGGVATFTDLTINKAGTGYTLAASSGVLTGAASSAFNITAGAADHLVLAQQPTNTTAGAAITPAVTVQILDASGNLTSSTANVTIAIGTNPGGGTLSGTATVAAVGGVATFSNLSIDKVGTGYTLSASSGALTGATSSAFNITVGAAAKLAFAQQPTNTTAGAAITPAVTVQILDASGNLTSSTANVTIAIGTNPGGGTLSGTTTVAAVSGVATFSNLSINKAGSGYTLTASSGALTGATSSTFDINTGAAASISFTTQPSNAVVNAAISPAVVVHVQDAAGNPVAADGITLSIQTNPSGATLSGGGSTATNANGDASFGSVALNKVGIGYTLMAADSSGTPLTTTSTAFDITADVANHVAFVQQPTDTTAGSGISPAVTVQVLDAGNNLVSSSTASITIGIGSNPGGSTLSGTATTSAVGGVATFSGLSLNKVGTGYTLTATGVGLSGATSSAFNISAGAAAAISFTTQPTAGSNITAGATIPLVAHVVDTGGNPVAGGSVTLSINGGFAGSTLSVTTNPVSTNASGDATFAGVSLDKVGTGTLKGMTGALTATSNSFNIVAGAAATISFAIQPSNATAGAAISPAIVAHVQDANGNAVSGDGVTLSIQNNAGGATLSGGGVAATNAGGNATFASVSLNKVGSGYTLKASDSSGTPLTVISNAFNISAGAAAAISYTTQPSNAAVNSAISPAIVVHVQDANGNAVSGDGVTLSIQNNAGGATLSGGGTTATNASGNATFASVSLNKIGSGYTLQAADSSGTPLTVVSNGFNITAGAAAKLAFTLEPSPSYAANAPITVKVSVEDGAGNVVTSSTSMVTLALSGGSAGASLTGTASVAAVAGVATFANLKVNLVGSGYVLNASAGGLTGAASSAFNITVGAPTLVFTQQPANLSQGGVLGSVQVTEQDAFGNVIPDNGTVTFTIQACGGNVTLGSMAMTNGLATLVSTQRFYTLASSLHVAAATASLNATSGGFDVIAGSVLFSNGFEDCRL